MTTPKKAPPSVAALVLRSAAANDRLAGRFALSNRLGTWTRHLEVLREGVALGVPGALLDAVALCCEQDFVLPGWLRREFLRAYYKGQNGGLRRQSWNEVFGKPPLTPGQRARQLRDMYAPREIWLLVQEAKRGGTSIDDELFKKVGGPFGLSSTETKKLYAASRRRHGKP